MGTMATRNETLAWVGAVLVALQFGLLALLAYAVVAGGRLGAPPLPALALVAAGTALGAWALSANRPGNFNIRPQPKTGSTLVQQGPYRWIRHPMYSSLLLAGTGAAFWSGQPYAWFTLGALALVLATKAHVEERAMMALHPDYEAYSRRRWRFVPGLY
jgi:protein-S-isoprenylcysteine O-methyltransferase Ste14